MAEENGFAEEPTNQAKRRRQSLPDFTKNTGWEQYLFEHQDSVD